MTDLQDSVNRICDKELLQFYLSFIAIYIGLYEFMKDTFCSRVEWFLSHGMIKDKDGNWMLNHSDEYNLKIKERLVDGKKVKDPFRNTILWFQEAGALTEDDCELFHKLREKRNTYAHDMTQHIWDGLPEGDAKGLIDLLGLYTKLDKWWINEIEIPISGDFKPDEYDRDNVQSDALLAYKIMINTLFGDREIAK